MQTERNIETSVELDFEDFLGKVAGDIEHEIMTAEIAKNKWLSLVRSSIGHGDLATAASMIKVRLLVELKKQPGFSAITTEHKQLAQNLAEVVLQNFQNAQA